MINPMSRIVRAEEQKELSLGRIISAKQPEQH